MKITVTPKVDFKTGVVEIDTETIFALDGFESSLEHWNRQVSRQTLNTQDKAIRTALIALGWTPPQ